VVLNVLLSFAQFEREMISERTRDKIAAARRKGKWAGGWPVLGYNVVDTKLRVNEEEAARVRDIYRLYLEKQSAIAVVQEINRRGWVTKQWTTHKGTSVGGRPFDKATLYKLLSNSVYIGKVRHKEDEFDGERGSGIVGVTSGFRIGTASWETLPQADRRHERIRRRPRSSWLVGTN
jgi:site-specific DNA recombinase